MWAVRGARVLVLGVAYKGNVSDTRESPAFALIKLIEGKGASVAYHDPFIQQIPKTREHADLAGRESVDLTSKSIKQFDAVLICTDHDIFDYDQVVKSARIVVDTRGVLRSKSLIESNTVMA